mmetsp:Transcript_8387/g.9298  ORF Transcript_8387/g.9298 Transcript_8387/m.9298 type:complete len:250 (+) Transcript_8387:65-814(+)
MADMINDDTNNADNENDGADNSSSMNINVTPSSPSKSSKKKGRKDKNKKRLQWDEAKILEHNKLRGTRMKIDEPNTPFAHNYDSGSETDGSFSSVPRNRSGSSGGESSGGGGVRISDTQISWDVLTNKLEAHAAVKDQVYPPSSPSASSRGGVTTDDEGGGSGSDGMNLATTSGSASGSGGEHEKNRDEQRKELKRLEFQELRKRHYNEMEVVRRFRRDHPDGVPSHNGVDQEHEQEHDDENDGDDENE